MGYGLDFAERFRNLPEICVLKPEEYNNSKTAYAEQFEFLRMLK